MMPRSRSCCVGSKHVVPITRLGISKRVRAGSDGLKPSMIDRDSSTAAVMRLSCCCGRRTGGGEAGRCSSITAQLEDPASDSCIELVLDGPREFGSRLSCIEEGNPEPMLGLRPGDEAQLVAVDGLEICECRREEDDEVEVATEVAIE